MATATALGEVSVLGSLLLQHLLHFSAPGLILRSLGALTGPQLLTLAQSPSGSHVLDAILTSPSVTRKQRRRVLKTLKVRILVSALFDSFAIIHLENMSFPQDFRVREDMRFLGSFNSASKLLKLHSHPHPLSPTHFHGLP